MKKEIKINIQGHTLNIFHCMAVELAFEQITGKPIFSKSINETTKTPVIVSNITTHHDEMSLYMASIVACNPDSPLTQDDADLFGLLTKEATHAEITQLDNAISSCMKDWYNIPDIMNSQRMDEEPDKEEGDSPKNS